MPKQSKPLNFEKHTNPITLKCKADLWQSVKKFCDKHNIKKQGFAEEALLLHLKRMQEVYRKV